MSVVVSCGYNTFFAVSACDGLCNLTKIMDRLEAPFGFQLKNQALETGVRFYSEIDQIHLSNEAQCVTARLPLCDCHNECTAQITLISQCFCQVYLL